MANRSFISFVPTIRDVKTLKRIIEVFLPLNKSRCYIGTPLDEKKMIKREIKEFEIDLEKWDRLYKFDCYYHDSIYKTYIFHGRMEYNKKLVYFEFHGILVPRAGIDHTRVFMSTDADLFMKSVLNEKSKGLRDVKRIRRALAMDKIELDEKLETFHKYYNKIIEHIPPFQNLTYITHKELYKIVSAYLYNLGGVDEEDMEDLYTDEFIDFILLRKYYVENWWRYTWN